MSAELLTKLANLTVLVFIVSNMLAFGMRLSPSEIIAPLRDVRHDLKVLLANFLVVPALAYFLLRVAHIEGSIAISLLLLAPVITSRTPSKRARRWRRLWKY